MKEESCQNCAYYRSCLVRSTIIFKLYIVTGRDQELRSSQDTFSVREYCGSMYKPVEKTE